MHNREVNGQNDLIETLTDITGAAIEFDLHQKPCQLINFIDLYCTYLRRIRSETNMNIAAVSFTDFVLDQELINTAADDTKLMTGENISTPMVLQLKSD